MAASLNTMTAASVTKSSNWPRESCQFHAVRTGVPSERAKYWRRRSLPKGVKPCQSRVLIICPLKHEIKKKVAKYTLFVKNCETKLVSAKLCAAEICKGEAVNKLRDVLDDTHQSPCYIETFRSTGIASLRSWKVHHERDLARHITFFKPQRRP